MDYNKLANYIMEHVVLTFKGNSEGPDFEDSVSASVEFDKAVLNHISLDELECFVIETLQDFSTWPGSGSGWADRDKVYVSLFGYLEGEFCAV